MYLVVNAYLDQSTKTVYFSEVSGLFTVHHGEEQDSTLTRGYLLATLQGLKRIRAHFGAARSIHILIADEKTCQKMTDLNALSLSKLHFDDGELWRELLTWKDTFTLEFFTSPSQSTELRYLWAAQRPATEAAPAIGLDEARQATARLARQYQTLSPVNFQR